MTEYKLFAQRVGLVGIVNLLVSLSGIILLPILTKTLPIEEYGIWVQIIVTITLISPIVGLGLPYTMVRFLAAEKDKTKIQEGFYSIVVFILFTSLAASFLLFVFSEPFAAAFLGNRADLIRIISLIIPIECLNGLYLNFFRTFQRIKKYSVFNILYTYGMVALVAYSLLSGYGIVEALISFLIARIIVFLLMASLIISEIGVKIPTFSHLKEYLRFGLPTVPGNFSAWIVNSSDRYIIGYFLGVAFVGYYSPGYMLGAMISMYVAPLGFLLPAVLSKLYDEGKEGEVKRYLEYTLKYFLMLAIPSAFGLSLLSKQLLITLSTSEIASYGYSITPFVAVSALFLGADAIIAQIIVLVKKTKIIGAIWMFAAIMNLGLNFVFIPHFGILGAAITTLIAYVLGFLLGYYYSFKYFKFGIDFRFILKSIFASIVMSLIIIKWNPIGTLNVLIVIGVCAVVYAAILLLLQGVKKEEIEFFKELFKV
ncbi:MAG TPA: polysaccharide biosynthesis protein [Methanophagales archaeon]|nr:polysaccharide biosynthesis protein [Methanophagales archaeon]